MEAVIGAAGLVFVAAVTPGPNNFVVMRAAARAGFAGVLPAIAGVVLGGLALLAIAVAGAGAAFVAEPSLRIVVAVGGCLYLSWLGARLVAGSFGKNAGYDDPDAGKAPSGAPSGAIGLFVFQFLNPKSWAMVLTATSAAQTGAGILVTFAQLAVLFAVIPTVCLLLWAALGSAISKHLGRPPVRVWFDRAMGLLLVVSAVLLVVEA